MLHTNLNTWHAQESRKTERGGGRGKTWKILPTLTHTIASRMRCCYPFPLLAAAQKPLESLPPGCVPCLWLPLTLPPTLSLSPSHSLLYPSRFLGKTPPGNKDKQKYFAVFSCRKKFAFSVCWVVLCVWVRA